MKVECYDTETIHGKAFLIASSECVQDVNSFDDCMEFIFRHSPNLCFAYNMDYDASAILKFLPPRDVDKIYLHTTLNVNGFRLVYIPAKIFRIVGHSRILEIFDLMQFYNMSLDNAAQKYLGEGKDDIPLEVKSNLGIYYPLPEWRTKVRNYCLRDARLTKRLAENFLSMLEQAGVSARKFYSTGYLAGKFLNRVNLGSLPEEHNQFVYQSYFGGRNECTQRGMIDRCFVYDIKSAYPSVIRTLKGLHNADFHIWKRPSKKADYSIMKMKIWLKPGRYIYPLPWKEKSKGYIFYPCIRGKEITITKPEWDVLEKHDLIDKVTGMETLNVYCREDYPFSFVNELFAERQKSPAHNYIYKIILNSIYGKFMERRPYVRRMDSRELFRYDRANSAYLEFMNYWNHAKQNCSHAVDYWKKDCYCEYCVMTRHVARWTKWKRKKEIEPIVVRDDDGDFQYYRKNQTPGNHFNSLYGTYITATIRSRIYDAAVSVGTDFVACFTDSIFSLSPLPEHFVSDKIGSFELKGIAENLVMVGTGVYEFDDADTKAQHTRFRGFKRSGGLRTILDSDSKEIELSSLQRITWGTIVQQTKTWFPDDFNRLVQRKRKLHVNFDNKRIWSSEFESGKQALNKRILSKPREI